MRAILAELGVDASEQARMIEVWNKVDLLAPAMLSALVVTQVFASDRELVVDARVPGIAAAAIAIWRGAHVVVAMVVAAAVTAAVRAFV